MKVIDLLNSKNVRAFSTLRDTMTPELPYSGFSTCSYTGDIPEHFTKCRSELADYLSIERDCMVFPMQTHSLNVALVTNPTDPLPDTDAVVTSLPGVALCIHTADCVPIVLTDTQNGIIAAAHSGWRGTAGRIAALTVDKMVEAGADRQNIIAAMGPCICDDCFEVGEEVAIHFDNYGTVNRNRNKPHVNLPESIAVTLESAGLKRDRILMPPACSRCCHSRFFSARRLGTASGRTLTVIIRR